MRLGTHHPLLTAATRTFRTLAASGAWLVLMAALVHPAALAATPVTYSASPTTGSLNTSDIVNVTLSVTNSVVIAGGSVHVAYSNGFYGAFQASGDPALSFVDYHQDQDDALFICNNNNCAPGTYPIATISVTAGQAGAMKVTFIPKETADQQLNTLQATGAEVNYTVNQQAGSSGGTGSSSGGSKSVASGSKTIPKSIFTVPQDNSNGLGTMPQQVTSEQFNQQNNQAQQQVESGTNSEKKTWTPAKIAIFGIAIGVGFTVLVYGIFRLIKAWLTPKNPFGPSDPKNMIYPH